MTPEFLLVQQLREIVRGLNSSRGFNWDLVADAYTTVAGYNLDVGELGDRLHDAYNARNTKQVWRAITMTGWECWGDLAQPLARHGDQAYFIDESTDRRLMLRAGLDFGPGYLARAGAQPTDERASTFPGFPVEQLMCTFHWPRAFYTERVAAISGKDVRSLMFSVMWPTRFQRVADVALESIDLRSGSRVGRSIAWRSSGNRVPVGAQSWETAMLGILDIYCDLPKITAFAALLLEQA